MLTSHSYQALEIIAEYHCSRFEIRRQIFKIEAWGKISHCTFTRIPHNFDEILVEAKR
jgi:hypothetical protein